MIDDYSMFGYTVYIDEELSNTEIEIRHRPPEIKMNSHVWKKVKEAYGEKDD